MEIALSHQDNSCGNPAKPQKRITGRFAMLKFKSRLTAAEVLALTCLALDPADYSPVTINTSISIMGVDGAGIDTKGGTGIITLNAPTPGVILAKALSVVSGEIFSHPKLAKPGYVIPVAPESASAEGSAPPPVVAALPVGDDSLPPRGRR
jgi:hypothetical protein